MNLNCSEKELESSATEPFTWLVIHAEESQRAVQTSGTQMPKRMVKGPYMYCRRLLTVTRIIGESYERGLDFIQQWTVHLESDANQAEAVLHLFQAFGNGLKQAKTVRSRRSEESAQNQLANDIVLTNGSIWFKRMPLLRTTRI